MVLRGGPIGMGVIFVQSGFAQTEFAQELLNPTGYSAPWAYCAVVEWHGHALNEANRMRIDLQQSSANFVRIYKGVFLKGYHFTWLAYSLCAMFDAEIFRGYAGHLGILYGMLENAF